MKKHLMIVPLLAIACVMVSLQSQAQAQNGVQVYALGGGFGQFFAGGRNDLYASGLIPTPPYFAIHPPVYYSMPVSRAYGYSPYAYPDYVRTPQPKAIAPVAYRNPYVEPAKDDSVELTDQTAAVVRATSNPFVDRCSESVVTAGVVLAR